MPLIREPLPNPVLLGPKFNFPVRGHCPRTQTSDEWPASKSQGDFHD